MTKPEDTCSSDWYDRLSLLLFGGLAAIILFTLPDYGMSWDEPFRWKGGQEKLLYYQALFGAGDAAVLGINPDHYPGLFDLSVALLNEITSLGLFLSGHILSSVFGFLALVAAWKIGRLIGGPRAAFWALLLAILTPRFYGHLFFNPKDIPFACTYLWATYGLIRILPSLPRPTWKQSIGLGVLIGLCTATRFAGIIQVGFAGLAAMAALIVDARTRNRQPLDWLKDLAWLASKGTALFVTALATVLPFWPYAQWKPLDAFFGTARATAHYDWNAPVLYLGERIAATELPWHYLPTWFAISTPLPILGLLALGLGFFILRLLQRNHRTVRFGQIALLAFVTFFPPFFAVAKSATVYDGLRHLLFVLPLIAVLAGLSFEFCRIRIAQFGSIAGVLPVLFLLAALVPTSIQMIRLHPYQYTYFNGIVGGLKGASGDFETDYWALSYRESIEKLGKMIQEGTIRNIPDSPKIFIHYLPVNAKLFAPRNWTIVDRETEADFILLTSRVPESQWPPKTKILSTERQGVTLSLFFRNQSLQTGPARQKHSQPNAAPLLQQAPSEENRNLQGGP